jgi:hypothetical protein
MMVSEVAPVVALPAIPFHIGSRAAATRAGETQTA